MGRKVKGEAVINPDRRFTLSACAFNPDCCTHVVTGVLTSQLREGFIKRTVKSEIWTEGLWTLVRQFVLDNKCIVISQR